jgi:hypothetical protein
LPELGSRGGASPALGKRDRPGSIWNEVKPWRMLAARVIHLGSWRKSAGVATARATAWAARVSRARRRARVPGARKGPWLRHLAHKLREFDAMLTRGLQWPELKQKEEDDDDPRRR